MHVCRFVAVFSHLEYTRGILCIYSYVAIAIIIIHMLKFEVTGG